MIGRARAESATHGFPTMLTIPASRLSAPSERTYIALFQPAEELADGAEVMLKGDLAATITHPDVWSFVMRWFLVR